MNSKADTLYFQFVVAGRPLLKQKHISFVLHELFYGCAYLNITYTIMLPWEGHLYVYTSRMSTWNTYLHHALHATCHRCGLTTCWWVVEFESVELRCQLCSLLDSTCSCSSNASFNSSLTHTLASFPTFCRLQCVELQYKDVDCLLFGSTCSCSSSASPEGIAH